MVNGIYTAARGMSNIVAKQDINSQNLSNTNTTGFKLARMVNRAEVSVGRSDEKHLVQQERQEVDDVYTSFEQGPMVRTGNNFDLAISGEGFFVVEGDDGNRYTRGGSFAMNATGELVTLGGRRILDENGLPIKLEGEKVQFMNDGGIFVDGNKAGKLGIVEFPDKHKLLYGAEGLFVNRDPDKNIPTPLDGGGVQQGFLEGSNVDPISVMVTMMSEFRNYEADQKALQAENETLGKAVNEVGRV